MDKPSDFPFNMPMDTYLMWIMVSLIGALMYGGSMSDHVFMRSIAAFVLFAGYWSIPISIQHGFWDER